MKTSHPILLVQDSQNCHKIRTSSDFPQSFLCQVIFNRTGRVNNDRSAKCRFAQHPLRQILTPFCKSTNPIQGFPLGSSSDWKLTNVHVRTCINTKIAAVTFVYAMLQQFSDKARFPPDGFTTVEMSRFGNRGHTCCYAVILSSI